jgi:outer membrane protein with beta-barrel domain
MRRITSLVALSLLTIASTASAQRSSAARSDNSNMPIELGFDAGINSELSGTNKTTAFQAPLQQIRAGFFMSPTVSIEPTLSLATQSTSGVANSSVTAYAIGTGVLWHLSDNRSANQIYLRPYLGFAGISTSGASASAFSFGGGVGYKMPMANRFATRLEANMSRTNAHNGVPAMNQLNLLAGLSVYSH